MFRILSREMDQRNQSEDSHFTNPTYALDQPQTAGSLSYTEVLRMHRNATRIEETLQAEIQSTRANIQSVIEQDLEYERQTQRPFKRLRRLLDKGLKDTKEKEGV